MFGGGQRIVKDLAMASVQGGVGAHIILLGSSEFVVNDFVSGFVEYDGRYNCPWVVTGTAWRLHRMLRSSGIRVIHTHGWDADIIGWLGRSGLAIRQLVHLHVMPHWLESRALKHKARRWLTKLALSGSDTQMVAVSDAVRRHWVSGLGVEPDRIRVVRNGVDVVRYQPSIRGGKTLPPVIGVAARLAPMKGIEYLIDALGVLADEGVAFELKIAGTGGLRNSLEQRCCQLGITEQTEFLGHMDDMPHFYRNIDLYALPSVTEGLPLGVLEAMASGIPVVATTVAGTPEAVRDGVDGLLVPPRNVCALTAALRQLLGDPEARRKMGESGRVRVIEAFSLERFSSEIFDIYREMLDDPGV